MIEEKKYEDDYNTIHLKRGKKNLEQKTLRHNLNEKFKEEDDIVLTNSSEEDDIESQI